MGVKNEMLVREGYKTTCFGQIQMGAMTLIAAKCFDGGLFQERVDTDPI